MRELGYLRDELARDYKAFSDEFMELLQVWRDDASLRFQRDFWDELEPEMRRYLESIEDLAAIIERAEMTADDN